jgi:hypothetical protein
LAWTADELGEIGGSWFGKGMRQKNSPKPVSKRFFGPKLQFGASLAESNDITASHSVRGRSNRFISLFAWLMMAFQRREIICDHPAQWIVKSLVLSEFCL